MTKEHKQIKPKKKRKKKSKIYFGKPAEDAIIEYNNSDDPEYKDKLFAEKIYYPLSKLAENLIHTFKFYNFDYPSEEVKQEVVSFLVLNMHKYQPDKGRAFSYFSIVAKNYLILNNNNNYKRMTQHVSPDKSLDLSDKFMTAYEKKEHQEQTSEFLNDMIIYLDDNLASLFKRKKDLNVADAVLELMKRSNDIENFNKKSLYILIREMTGSNTQHITRVINILKRYYKKLHLEYSKHGTLEYLSSGSIFM